MIGTDQFPGVSGQKFSNALCDSQIRFVQRQKFAGPLLLFWRKMPAVFGWAAQVDRNLIDHSSIGTHSPLLIGETKFSPSGFRSAATHHGRVGARGPAKVAPSPAAANRGLVNGGL